MSQEQGLTSYAVVRTVETPYGRLLLEAPNRRALAWAYGAIKQRNRLLRQLRDEMFPKSGLGELPEKSE